MKQLLQDEKMPDLNLRHVCAKWEGNKTGCPEVNDSRDKEINRATQEKEVEEQQKRGQKNED